MTLCHPLGQTSSAALIVPLHWLYRRKHTEERQSYGGIAGFSIPQPAQGFNAIRQNQQPLPRAL